MPDDRVTAEAGACQEQQADRERRAPRRGESGTDHRLRAASSSHCRCRQSPATSDVRLTGTVVDPLPRPAQTLLDDRGRPVSLADRPADGLTVLVFGYRHCPDFCPTTAADLAAARATLPLDQCRQVQVLFVTEDPRRDTPPVLRRWLHSFDDSYIGLIGGNAEQGDARGALQLPHHAGRRPRNTDPAP